MPIFKTNKKGSEPTHLLWALECLEVYAWENIHILRFIVQIRHRFIIKFLTHEMFRRCCLVLVCSISRMIVSGYLFFFILFCMLYSVDTVEFSPLTCFSSRFLESSVMRVGMHRALLLQWTLQLPEVGNQFLLAYTGTVKNSSTSFTLRRCCIALCQYWRILWAIAVWATSRHQNV